MNFRGKVLGERERWSAIRLLVSKEEEEEEEVPNAKVLELCRYL